MKKISNNSKSIRNCDYNHNKLEELNSRFNIYSMDLISANVINGSDTKYLYGGPFHINETFQKSFRFARTFSSRVLRTACFTRKIERASGARPSGRRASRSMLHAS